MGWLKFKFLRAAFEMLPVMVASSQLKVEVCSLGALRSVEGKSNKKLSSKLAGTQKRDKCINSELPEINKICGTTVETDDRSIGTISLEHNLARSSEWMRPKRRRKAGHYNEVERAIFGIPQPSDLSKASRRARKAPPVSCTNATQTRASR